MGWLDEKAKGTVATVEDGAVGAGNTVDQSTGLHWNPAKTAVEDLNNPGSGESGAAKNAGSDVSNAWKTSVNDPLSALSKHLSDMWGKTNQNVAAPTLPGMPAVPGVAAPGGSAGGGYPPSMSPIAVHPVAGISGASVGYGQPANDPFRQQQTALMSQLAGQANGTAPSIAQQQLQQGQQANIAATMAALASQRGQANPLAQRQAMQSMGDINAQTNQQAAMARLQEQQQAQSLLGQVAGQGRTGDVAQGNLGVQQGQLQLSAQDLDLKAQIANKGANQAQADLAAKYAAMGLDSAKANQQAAIQIAQLQQQGVLGIGALQMQSGAAQNALLGQALGAGGTLAGAAATAMSDERLKTDIKSGDAKLEKFLMAVGAHEYKYKDDKFGKGRRISPMAQELEADDTGKAFVKETSEGKAVDYGKALGTMLSAQGMLMRRIKQLEGSN